MMRIKDTFAITALTLAMAFGAAACDDDDDPTDPSDETYEFRATLSGANEVPPVSNAEAGATGTANITLEVTRDGAGTITAAQADFEVSLDDFPDGTAITMAHIHTGAAGQVNSPVVDLALAPGEITLGDGSGTIDKDDVTVTVDVANQIISNPAGFYFNAHTALNPGGAARGQLAVVD